MTQEQINELRRLAEAATPGPWYDRDGVLRGTGGGIKPIATIYNGLNSPYIAAANPSAILDMIAEVESLRDQVNGLTGSLDHAEKALKESRANDMAAMSWLADCRIASGDHGKRMLPEFVEYLREMKRQRDELLAALELFMERVVEPPEANCSCHISPPCNDCVENWGLREAFSDAKAAISKAEAKS